MRTTDRTIRSTRVVLADGVRPAAITIDDGIIARITGATESSSGAAVDYGDLVIMPGIVDTHVHINEPGRSEWEGFETATMAAAAGGVTTLIEMPLNSIPATTTRDALRGKIAAAEQKLHVDVGFWGGVVPGNKHELGKMYEDGAFGFKCFLVPSGVPEFEAVTESDLRQAIPELVRMGTVLLVHAELPGPIDLARNMIARSNPRSYSTWLKSRPPSAENQAVDLLVELAEQYQARVHIVHLSSASAIPKIDAARQRGIRISVETCPHYLTLVAEEISDGCTAFKCAPPIREATNQEDLWTGLRKGIIDFVVTDHSPAPPEMKCLETGDFMEAWGGIASLQLSLPLIWTAAHKRGFGIEQVAKWLCTAPARMARLAKKGEIKVGAQADLVVWDPEQSFHVQADKMLFRHKLTPYRERQLFGVIQATFLRGEEIYSSGRLDREHRGHVLRRGEA